MSSEMLFEAAILLNDVHLELEGELEDDDRDVVHVVIPPDRFKVVMKKLRMTKLRVLNWKKMTV